MSYFNVYMRTIDNESAELDLFTTDKETAEKSARAYASKEGKKVVICNVKELFFLEPSLVKEKPVTRAKDIIDYSDLSSIREKEKRDRERLERQRLYFSPIVERENGEPALPEAHSIGLGGLLSKVLNNGKDYFFQNGSLANSSPSYLLLLENWRRTGKFYESDSIPAIICKDFSEKETELSGSDIFYCELLFLYLTDYKLFQRDGLFSYEQKRDILRIILDNPILDLIGKNLTLDLLTLVYENREPTAREREKWDNLTGKCDEIKKLLNVGDLLRIYRALKDLQIELPESTQATREELEKIVPTKEYTTKTSSGEFDDIPHFEQLSTPTHPNFNRALSLWRETSKSASLVVRPQELEWDDEEKKWLKNGQEIDIFDLADVILDKKKNEIDMKDEKSNVDTPFLLGIYSIFYEKFKEKNIGKSVEDELEIDDTYTFYVPELLRELNDTQTYNPDKLVNATINKLHTYADLIGVFWTDNGKRYEMALPLLQFSYKDNELTLKSPYFVTLMEKMNNARIIRNKKTGEILRKKDGTPKLEATHSDLIKKSIIKQKNKKASYNVILLVQQIETAGNPKKGEERVVSISTRTLVERNPELEQALEEAKDTRTKNKILQRTFSKTYELLVEETLLSDRYEGFQLEEAPVPTIKSLNTDIIRIVHKGKRLHKG